LQVGRDSQPSEGRRKGKTYTASVLAEELIDGISAAAILFEGR
jgi:hypothetical protein